MSNPMLWIIVAGCACAAGVFLIVVALRPAPVRLGDMFAHLDGEIPQLGPPAGVIMVDSTAGSLDRFGAWCYQRFALPVSKSTTLMLALNQRSIGDFFAEKAIWVIAGIAAPAVYGVSSLLFGGELSYLPWGFSLIGGVVGYFVPDLRLRRSASATKQGAAEALFMFFDLVILERLANRSVTQSLHSVAAISQVSVFQRIRTALERARLEQSPPWQELRKVADELDLAMITDMADVLKLDEQGAALAEPLRVRVKELRDAQLTQAKQEAQEHTERMTLWMTLPVLIFGLVFIAPPLLMMLQNP